VYDFQTFIKGQARWGCVGLCGVCGFVCGFVAVLVVLLAYSVAVFLDLCFTGYLSYFYWVYP
jgi:hypothetical protein